jgi:hypothetical protein
MCLLPHAPPCSVSPSTMSSHQDPYHCSGPSQIYHESDSESRVVRQLRPPGQSWPPTATISDQSGYYQPQPHESLDPVRDSLEVHDAEVCSCHNFYNPASHPPPLSDPQDMNYAFNYLDLSSSLPSTSLQVPDVGPDTTHATSTNDDHLFHQLPFYYYPGFDHAPYGPAYYPSQGLLHDAHQHPAQDSQSSQDHFTFVYPHLPSTQFLSPSHGGHVYGTDTRAPRPTPDSLTLDGVDTARTNADAGQHSHPSPVATSPSNQTSAPGPSRPPPSSPERKRLLPLSTADELSVSAVC